jgi:hypothetical protein
MVAIPRIEAYKYGHMKDFVKWIKTDSFVFTFLDVLCLVLPGSATIFVFAPDLFVSLDWVKLVLLSASIPLLFVIINLITVTDEIVKENEKDGLFRALTVAILMTSFVFFGALCASYAVEFALLSSPALNISAWLLPFLARFGVRLHMFIFLISLTFFEAAVLYLMKETQVKQFVATTIRKLIKERSEKNHP